MTAKLHQIIAVEKGVKSRVMKNVTAAYHALQKAHTLFSGMTKTYQKKEDEGVDLPPKRQLVQASAEELLANVAEQMTELIDTVARKDAANCQAKADVVVDGQPLLKDVPATHLLFLEKLLKDLETTVNEMPVLDPAHNWQKDEATGLFKSDPVKTTQMQKVQEGIVLYDATEHHPAQTQLITKDVIVGTWTQVLQSGAVTADRKKDLQKRVQKLIKAVKYAREEANEVEAAPKDHGEAIFGYLLG